MQNLARINHGLRDAKLADLLVKQAREIEFASNLKTAKQIGITIPPSILYRADKIIK